MPGEWIGQIWEGKTYLTGGIRETERLQVTFSFKKANECPHKLHKCKDAERKKKRRGKWIEMIRKKGGGVETAGGRRNRPETTEVYRVGRKRVGNPPQDIR